MFPAVHWRVVSSHTSSASARLRRVSGPTNRSCSCGSIRCGTPHPAAIGAAVWVARFMADDTTAVGLNAANHSTAAAACR